MRIVVVIMLITLHDAVSACGAPIVATTHPDVTARRLVTAIAKTTEVHFELQNDESPFLRRRAEDHFGDSLYFLLQLAAAGKVDLGDLKAEVSPIPKTLMSFHMSSPFNSNGVSSDSVQRTFTTQPTTGAHDISTSPEKGSEISSGTESPQLLASAGDVVRTSLTVQAQNDSAIKGCLRKTPRSTASGSPRPELSPTPPATVQFAEPPPTTDQPDVAASPSARPNKLFQSPVAMRSRDAIQNPSQVNLMVTHTNRAAGPPHAREFAVFGHSRTGSDRIQMPASPTGQPLIGILDDQVFVTSDDDLLGALNAITVTSIHSASASPGGSKLVPPRTRPRGPSPRPPSTAALVFRQPAASREFSPPTALKACEMPPKTEVAKGLPPIPSKEDLDATLLAGPPQFGSDGASDAGDVREDDDVSSLSSGHIRITRA